MVIKSLKISNFKSIKELEIEDILDVLILVGKNNAGKSSIMSAVRGVLGDYEIKPEHSMRPGKITIGMSLEFSNEDFKLLHSQRAISRYRDFDKWKAQVNLRLPSLVGNVLSFEYICHEDGTTRYKDCKNKDNPYIKEVLPTLYFIGHTRGYNVIEDDILMLQENKDVDTLRDNRCIFDNGRPCNQCFNCIGVINKKSPEKLTVLEAARLFQYKLFSLNLSNFEKRINRYFAKNGGVSSEIHYEMKFDVDEVLKIEKTIINKETGRVSSMDSLSEGYKSIYTLSLLEAYIEEKKTAPYIIMIEDPEMYLHPQLQKVASEILYRLSKKNQVIFSTHSPNMIFNFTSKQIRQVMLDKEYTTKINPRTNIDHILDDLGYTANDMMNVNFVFFVEGKQDRNRLPLILDKYYTEADRVSIITTNSCTNIKTYANLKYMNQLYIKDQFLMVRDGDGKDREELTRQLCGFYENAKAVDAGYLPRVTRQNVLILKYYSLENYFLDPAICAKIGVVKSEDEFFEILYSKYKEYLYKLNSAQKMCREKNITINSIEDIKDNFENIKIYVRGHNLYDIFYGRYKGENEQKILKQYVGVAPREIFKDILDSVESFVYFNSRKR